MSKTREEYQAAALEAAKPLREVIAEAKKDGYAIEVFASLDMSAQPSVRATVSLR